MKNSVMKSPVGQEAFEGSATCSNTGSLLVKYTCGLIEDRNDFCRFGLMDNFEAITLKPQPSFWCEKMDNLFFHDLRKYCEERAINYYLIREVGKGGNWHYHGLMGFANNKVRRLFTSWYNKKCGKLYVSPLKSDVNGWYNYVHKTQEPLNSDHIYLFGDQPYPIEVSLSAK